MTYTCFTITTMSGRKAAGCLESAQADALGLALGGGGTRLEVVRRGTEAECQAEARRLQMELGAEPLNTARLTAAL